MPRRRPFAAALCRAARHGRLLTVRDGARRVTEAELRFAGRGQERQHRLLTGARRRAQPPHA